MVSARETLDIVKAMEFLIKNFPENIVGQQRIVRKEYVSVIDFINDIMVSIGVNPSELMDYLFSDVFGISSISIRNAKNTADINSKIEGLGESQWLNTIEKAVKEIIAASLSGYLSCSANPIIPDSSFDAHAILDTESFVSYAEGGVKMKLSEIDPLGFLNNCPSGRFGRMYYDDVDGLAPYDMYRSSDFNAFLWYTTRNGMLYPQYERNKNMWDDRYRSGIERTDEEWDEWLGSKKIKAYDKRHEESKLDVEINGKKGVITPILQVDKSDCNNDEIRIQIASQTYYRSRKVFSVNFDGKPYASMDLNRTLFRFNRDYLNSIKLYSAKTFYAGFLTAVYNGQYICFDPFDFNRTIGREKIRIIISKILENIDTGTEDCYFTFSNEEYDNMLEAFEMGKYNASKYRDASGKYAKSDREANLEKISSLLYPENADTTFHDEREMVKSTMREMSMTEIPGTEDTYSVDISENWLHSFLTNIVEQLILPVFSPKVLMLFVMNFKMLGYSTDMDYMNLSKRIVGVIISICASVVKSILGFVFQFLFNWLIRLVTSYNAMQLAEKIKDYIDLLTRARTFVIPRNLYIPKFFTYTDGTADNVDYADIIPEKITPNTEKGC